MQIVYRYNFIIFNPDAFFILKINTPYLASINRISIYTGVE